METSELIKELNRRGYTAVPARSIRALSLDKTIPRRDVEIIKFDSSVLDRINHNMVQSMVPHLVPYVRFTEQPDGQDTKRNALLFIIGGEG